MNLYINNSSDENIKEIEVDIANKFFTKLKGLMFQKEICKPMMFFNCRQIHTFFMKVSIDVYYFDKEMKIIDIDLNVSPSKIGKHVKKAYGVIETSKNSNLLKIGDSIKLSK